MSEEPKKPEESKAPEVSQVATEVELLEAEVVEANEPQPGRRTFKMRPRYRQGDDGEEYEVLDPAIEHFRHNMFAATPTIYITKLLLIVNIAYFAWMIISGVHFMSPQTQDIVTWGGNFGPQTLGGEWWRLVSCMFIHIGILHLLFNMWVLWDLGRLVERLVGPVGFFMLYMLSGIGGSLASVGWNPGVVSAGASGAVFGVLGAMMGFVLLRRDSIPAPVLKSLRNTGFMFFGINFALGMSIKGIDMAAHMGGFGVGVLCGILLSQPIVGDEGMRGRRAFRNGLMACVTSLAMVGAGVFFVMPKASQAAAIKLMRQGILLIDSASNKLRDVNKQRDAKKWSGVVYTKQLETQVLPAWKRAENRLNQPTLDELPGRKKKALQVLRSYIKANKESLELWIKGTRTNNPALYIQANQRKKAATKMIGQLEKLLKR